MRTFYIIFLLVFLFDDKCFSQDSTNHVFHLNELPQEGVLLDKGWKFHAGDNPEWARPEYDDSEWKPVSPAYPIHQIDRRTPGSLPCQDSIPEPSEQTDRRTDRPEPDHPARY